MRLPDLMATGWAEIWAHKMRSFLSFFAIAIGIATFFYTLSVLSQSYGRIGRMAQIAGAGRISTKTRHRVTLAQYKNLQGQLPPGSSVSLVTDDYWIQNSHWNNFVHRGNRLYGGAVMGILPSFKEVDFVYQLEGRFINWQDVENKHRVIVLTVFPHQKKERNPWLKELVEAEHAINLEDYTAHHHLLNQQVTLNNQTFTIVGLLHMPPENKDDRAGDNREYVTTLYVPYTTWYDLYPDENDTRPVAIRVVTGKESSARQASNTLTSFLRSQFGLNEKPNIEFFYDKLKKRLTNARKSLNNMLFMGLIAMIAGGIGIMNVTMAVIFSRTKEIGIRRALGASRQDILFQFVVEAMLLGLCGAVAGMILGYMALLHLAENTSQMTFSWWVILLSVLIALVTSFLFALYPAWQAAKLKPVEALKNE